MSTEFSYTLSLTIVGFPSIGSAGCEVTLNLSFKRTRSGNAGSQSMTPLVPKQIDCIIIDLFGVIVTFDDRLVYDRIAQKCPDPTAAAEHLNNLVSEPDLIRGRVSQADLHARLHAELGYAGTFDDFKESWSALYSSPMPGMRDLLKNLANQCQLVLLSNVDPFYWPTVSESIPELKRFHASVLSFERGIAKPEPEAFGCAIRASGVAIDCCFFVDDKQENIDAAAELGLSGHLFRDVVSLKSALRQAGLGVQ